MSAGMKVEHATVKTRAHGRESVGEGSVLTFDIGTFSRNGSIAAQCLGPAWDGVVLADRATERQCGASSDALCRLIGCPLERWIGHCK